jgi:YesN/AraC family two-component response regulator
VLDKQMKVLVVEDDYSSRELLKICIEKEGYQCQTANDGVDGFNLFKKFNPDLIISDVRMPNMTGIELLESIRKISKDVIIVFITGHGNEELALQALQLGANNYIKKPVDISEIKTLTNRYYDVIKSKAIQSNIVDLIKHREMEIEIESDMNLVQSLANYLSEKTGNYFDSKERMRIELGINELLINAIEHGNWDISYEEKNQALLDDRISDLYKTKREDPINIDKKVLVKFKLSEKFCEWIITDEGKGFDWKTVYNPIDTKLSRMNGRGILLSKLQFDELEYIGKGNVVRLKKYFNI